MDSPFVTVWYNPRRMAQTVIEKKGSLVIPLSLLIGAYILPNLISGPSGADSGWRAVLFATITSVFAIALYLLLITKLGNALDGVATWRDVVRAVGYGTFPSLVATLLFLLALQIGGAAEIIALALFAALIGFWLIGIYAIIIAEVHQFSIWKAFIVLIGCLLLTFAIAVVISFSVLFIKIFLTFFG